MKKVEKYESSNGRIFDTKREALEEEKRHQINALFVNRLDFNEYYTESVSNQKKAWANLLDKLNKIIYDNIDEYNNIFNQQLEEKTPNNTQVKLKNRNN